jgi:hypothetical protein
MAQSLADIRGEDGQLPAYAFPGGYPMMYVTRGGDIICPACANDTAYTAAADSPFDDISNSGAIAVRAMSIGKVRQSNVTARARRRVGHTSSNPCTATPRTTTTSITREPLRVSRGMVHRANGARRQDANRGSSL